MSPYESMYCTLFGVAEVHPATTSVGAPSSRVPTLSQWRYR